MLQKAGKQLWGPAMDTTWGIVGGHSSEARRREAGRENGVGELLGCCCFGVCSLFSGLRVIVSLNFSNLHTWTSLMFTDDFSLAVLCPHQGRSSSRGQVLQEPREPPGACSLPPPASWHTARGEGTRARERVEVGARRQLPLLGVIRFFLRESRLFWGRGC